MKLIYDECLHAMDSLITAGVKIDAIITDIPYGTTQCKWDVVIPFELMWKRIELLRKKKTAVILFGSEPFSSALRMSNIKNYKYDWVWNKILKTGHLNSKRRPMLKHEMIHVFYPHNYYPVMEEGVPLHSEGVNRNVPKNNSYGAETRKYSDRKGSTLKYPNSLSTVFQKPHSSKAVHPNEKPILLMEYLVRTYTKEGEIVLDFTMGSGSTGVACNNLGRDFIGIENDIDHYKTAEERLRRPSVAESQTAHNSG